MRHASGSRRNCSSTASAAPAGFVGVLQQVEQCLLGLRGVDADDAVAVFAAPAERDLRGEAGEEAAPLHRLAARGGQLGEARVVADEAFQMATAFFDRRQRLRQLLRLAAPQQFLAGMRQRGDRRQRVVELVADDADHLLPGLHFLPAQFGGELAQKEQFVRLAVEVETAAREVDHLLVVVVAGDVEQRVAAAGDGLAQCRMRGGHQRVEGAAFQALAITEQPPRREVGQHDAPGGIHQQQRHRRVLHHRVQQQLALHQRQPLRAQGVAQGVVGIHQFGHVVARRGQAVAVVAVAVAGDQRQQGAASRRIAREQPPDQPGQQQPRGEAGGQCPVRRPVEMRADGGHGDGQQQAARQREQCAPAVGQGGQAHGLSRARCRGGPCAGTAPAATGPVRRRPVR